MTIELHVLKTGLGGEAVLATPEDLERMASAMPGDSEDVRAVLAEQKALGLANWEALSGQAEVRSFPFRPYTGRELILAEASAITRSETGHATTDAYLLERALVCFSCAMSEEEFDGLSVSVQRALATRVRLHSEPRTETLRFLL